VKSFVLLLPVVLAAVLASAAGAAPPPHSFVGAGELELPSVAVRSAPSASAPAIARLPQFRREDFRHTTVLALAVRRAKNGRPAWYRISIPGRPNGRTGWIPARSAMLRPVHRQLVIRRGARRMELWHDGRLEYATRVAVGAPGMETPLGLFYVTVRFKPVQQPFLGVFAFETSAYSRLSDWPGGGKVGIHGTYQPWLLGKAVSHGCVRMSNAAAIVLRNRVPVGTPIRILP
jgi:lipoprotein-anchoring transpeptidase ErfK/SrfK